MNWNQAILRIVSIVFLVAAVGCSVGQNPGFKSRTASLDSKERAAQATTFVFDTIEAAAIDALANAHFSARIEERDRLRMATIQRVEGGYTWSEPRVSRHSFYSASAPIVRHRLGPNDVATYVVHPRTGDRRIDRMNERPNEREEQIVNELDPLHRPLYLLTPSLKIVELRHRGEQLTTIAELPRRRGESRLQTADRE